MKAIVVLMLLLLVTGCNSALTPVAAMESSPGAGAGTSNGKVTYFSQGEVGNGGHGKIINGRVYLMDLVEVGMVEPEYNDYIPDWVKKHGHFEPTRKRIKEALGTEELPLDEITEVILSISQKDPLVANTLLDAMKLYRWVIIDEEFKLLPLDGNIIENKEGDIVLLANRRGRTVHISRPYLRRMNKKHQGALVIHEVTCPLVPPRKVMTADGSEMYAQDSARGREITGLFYTLRNESSFGFQGFARYLSPAEFPFISGAPNLDDNTVTSSNFEKITYGPHSDLGEGVLSVLGPVHLEYKVAGKRHNETFRFDFDEDYSTREGKVKRACSLWYENESGTLIPDRVGIDVVFEPKGDFGVHQLKFAEYYDGKEVKQYLKHEKIDERRVAFLDFFFSGRDTVANVQSAMLEQKAYPGKPKYVEALNTARENFLKDCNSRMVINVYDSFIKIMPVQGFATKMKKEHYVDYHKNIELNHLRVLGVYQGVIEDGLKRPDLDADERRNLEGDLERANRMVERQRQKAIAEQKANAEVTSQKE